MLDSLTVFMLATPERCSHTLCLPISSPACLFKLKSGELAAEALITHLDGLAAMVEPLVDTRKPPTPLLVAGKHLLSLSVEVDHLNNQSQHLVAAVLAVTETAGKLDPTVAD